MKKSDLKKIPTLIQNILRLFQANGRIELHPHVLADSERDSLVSIDPNLWKLAEVALLDAERRKAEAYRTRLHDSAL